MPNLVEKDGKQFLELKRDEWEAAGREQGWMDVIEETDLPELGTSDISPQTQEAVSDPAFPGAEQQAKVDQIAQQMAAIPWTLSKQADLAEDTSTTEEWVCGGCTYYGPAQDFMAVKGYCPECGGSPSNIQR